MRLMVASLLFLLPIVYARGCVGFIAYHFDLYSIGNSFGIGSIFLLTNLRNELDRCRSSAYGQSAAIVLSAADDSAFLEWQILSRATMGVPQHEPMVVNNPKVPECCQKEGMLCL